MLGSLLRKLRGIVGTGISWAVGWCVGGSALHWSLGFLGLVSNPDMMVAPFLWGLLGFYGGSLFGGVLALTENNRSLSQLRLGRVALWGALAGLFVPVVYHLLGGGAGLSWFSSFWTSPSVWVSGAIITLLGSGSAVGMTAVARSSPDSVIGEGEKGPLLSTTNPG